MQAGAYIRPNTVCEILLVIVCIFKTYYSIDLYQNYMVDTKRDVHRTERPVLIKKYVFKPTLNWFPNPDTSTTGETETIAGIDELHSLINPA